MAVSRSTIDAIQSRVNIVDIVSEYIGLRKRGSNYLGLCPFHNEKTPSFSVSEEKGLFYCFGCKESGNVFHFLMKYKNMTFYEVLVELGGSLGIEVLDSGGSDEYSILLGVFSSSSELYSNLLVSSELGSRARIYLAGRKIRRGIGIFCLGYAPLGSNFLLSNLSSYKRDDLFRSSLIRRGRDNSVYDYFRDRIIFPICDEYDRVIAFGGRLIGAGEPKYLNSPENYYFRKRETLYGLNKAKEAIKSKGFAVVVEGYFDVIFAYELGIENVLAPLGTSLTESHINKIKRYCKKVVFVFDGDTGGEKALRRGLVHSLNAQLDSYVFPMPEGKDPYDYLIAFGKDAFLEGLDKAEEGIDYYIKWEFNRKERIRDYQKREYLNSIYSFLHSLDSEVEKEQCLNKLAILLKLSFSSIKRDFTKLTKPQSVRSQKIKRDDITIYIKNTSELYLIFIILNNVELFKQYKSRIPIDLFKDALGKSLFFALSSVHEQEGKIDIHHVLSSIEDKEDKSMILSELMNEAYKASNPIEIIEDCINKIKLRDVVDRKKVAIREKNLKLRDDANANIDDLLEEIQFLANEENKLKKKEIAI